MSAVLLIEVFVVITIIGILASLVFVLLRGAPQKARDAKRKVEICQIGSPKYYQISN